MIPEKNNNNFHIRRAVAADCPAIIKLVTELAEIEKAPDAVTVSLSHFESSGFGENPVWWAFVVENEAKDIIAFALYYIRFSTWKGQRLYLEDLLVTEKYKRQGIGKKLMETLKKEAREKNLNAICWQVLDWNTPAIEFYKQYPASFDEEWVNVVWEL